MTSRRVDLNRHQVRASPMPIFARSVPKLARSGFHSRSFLPFRLVVWVQVAWTKSSTTEPSGRFPFRERTPSMARVTACLCRRTRTIQATSRSGPLRIAASRNSESDRAFQSVNRASCDENSTTSPFGQAGPPLPWQVSPKLLISGSKPSANLHVH